jgi:hypothetical protein
VKTSLKNFGLYVLSAFLGIILLISACLKFISIDLFELNLVETGLIEWGLAPWISLLIIGVELFLGILIILNVRLKGFILWFSLGLLTFFSFYLFVVMLTKGNGENCNCFGSFLILNPAQSLLKNFLLIVINVLLIRYHKGINWKYPKLMVTGAIIVAFFIPCTIHSINLSINRPAINASGSFKVNLDLLYGGSTFIRPVHELREGKQIVAFLSLNCPYCLMTGYKFHLLKRKNPAIPIYFILSGKINSIPKFLTETKSYNIPHTMLFKQDFISLVGREVPVILYIDDGVVVKKINYQQIDQKDIEMWLNLSEPQKP